MHHINMKTYVVHVNYMFIFTQLISGICIIGRMNILVHELMCQVGKLLISVYIHVLCKCTC